MANSHSAQHNLNGVYVIGPGSSSKSLSIFAKSSSGFGPKCDGGDGRRLMGVPARELLMEERGTLLCESALRGPGGADMGRVLICSGGIAFPLVRGSTSSRLIGNPNVMRCCRRIRDRVQFGGFVDGGDSMSILYKSRLDSSIKPSKNMLSNRVPFRGHQYLTDPFHLTNSLICQVL